MNSQGTVHGKEWNMHMGLGLLFNFPYDMVTQKYYANIETIYTNDIYSNTILTHSKPVVHGGCPSWLALVD